MKPEYLLAVPALLIAGWCALELVGRFMDWRERNRERRDYE